MKGKKEIVQQLRNYIDFDNAETLSWLNGLADDAFFHKTEEGYLGSILIHHQLAENLLINLIEKSNLIIQSSIYPTKYPDLFKKQKDGKKFSQWISMLNQHTVEFPKKKKIMQLSKNINDIRNQFAHKITSGNINDIKSNAEECKKQFDELFTTWKETSKIFYDSFRELHKDFN